MIKQCTIALFVASILCSCSMAPKYVRPDAPVDETYPAQPASSVETPAKDIAWDTFFHEERLRKLITIALEQNRDLRVAALRIEEARALYNIQWSQRLPHIDVSGQAARMRTTADLSASGQIATTGNYNVGLSIAAFELDFFGRVKSLSDAALSQYLATEEARRAAQISLVSDVAKTYLTERAQARQLELAQQFYETYKTTYQLTKKRYEVGIASALDLRQFETLMENARVAVATLSIQRAQTENALIVLIGGKHIDNLPPANTLSEENIMQDIPAGLPSDLLANRPDIRQFEFELKAANANIGAARAAFFPQITLTAFGGTASTALSGLFKSGSKSWSFTPLLNLPIFDAGSNLANLDLAHARKNIAIAQYEKTIQVAFREVADALVARDLLNDQVSAQTAVLNAETARVKLSTTRYAQGISSSLDLLDAQRQQFSAEQSLVQARLSRMLNTIDLYRSLGGGLITTDVAKKEPSAEDNQSS